MFCALQDHWSSGCQIFVKSYVVGAHQNCLAAAILMSTHNIGFYGEAILMSTHNICFYGEISKIIR